MNNHSDNRNLSSEPYVGGFIPLFPAGLDIYGGRAQLGVPNNKPRPPEQPDARIRLRLLPGVHIYTVAGLRDVYDVQESGRLVGKWARPICFPPFFKMLG